MKHKSTRMRVPIVGEPEVADLAQRCARRDAYITMNPRVAAIMFGQADLNGVAEVYEPVSVGGLWGSAEDFCGFQGPFPMFDKIRFLAAENIEAFLEQLEYYELHESTKLGW